MIIYLFTFQRLPGGLVPDAEPLDLPKVVGACERLQEDIQIDKINTLLIDVLSTNQEETPIIEDDIQKVYEEQIQQPEIKEIYLENIVQSVKKIHSSEKVNKQGEIEGVFLLNEEEVIAPLIEENKEEEQIIDDLEVLGNNKEEKMVSSDKKEEQEENNNKEKPHQLNSDKFSGIPIRNVINKEENPFIRNIKQKKFIKNKFVKSDRNTSFYKKKYEENSANFQSMSEHSNTVILDTDVKDDDTIISSKITKNKIELEGYSSNDENEEDAEDDLDI